MTHVRQVVFFSFFENIDFSDKFTHPQAFSSIAPNPTHKNKKIKIHMLHSSSASIN